MRAKVEKKADKEEIKPVKEEKKEDEILDAAAAANFMGDGSDDEFLKEGEDDDQGLKDEDEEKDINGSDF